MSKVDYLKRIAKKIKKKNPHIKLHEVHRDLARYLKFQNWKHLIDSNDDTLQRAIDKNPVDKL